MKRDISNTSFTALRRCFLAAVASLSIGQLHSAAFEHEYSGEALPNESTPAWRFGGRAQEAEVSLSEGKLKVATLADKRVHYSLGILEDGSESGSGTDGWDASSGTSTIDFRLKCKGGNPNSEAFVILVSDGNRNWRISFYPEFIRVGGKDIEIPAGQADTYRITLDGERLQLSSATGGVLQTNVPGRDGYNRNRILLGNFAQGEPASTPVEWELDFLRWTNKEADLSPPPQN